MMNLKKLLLFSMLLLDVWTLMAQNWSELGTGSNALNANDWIRSVIIDSAGKVYAGGDFVNASGKQYVAKWNGTSWSELGTGTNALSANDFISAIFRDPAGNVYASGAFTNASGKQYVAKWNGTSWSELGTGANALNANDFITTIVMDPAGNIYATGLFTNASGKQYVAKWNGTSWSELGIGPNALNANGWIRNIIRDPAGNIYAGGSFTNSAGKQYVAKWNGTSWSELGAGVNALNANDLIHSIISDAAGNVYAAGYFSNTSGNPYVAKWNGSTWTELGTGANALNVVDYIQSITMDTSGNVYAAGFFTNSAGQQYVAKWNGTSWSELGTGANALNANARIQRIVMDPTGNIYAGGSFTNTSGKQYVAKWSNSVVAVDSIDVHTVGNVAATITTSGGTLPMAAVVFPATAGQAVSWSIIPGTGTASISTAGLVTAQSNGTVWAKAVSVGNIAKKDSLLITISNQTVISVDSIDVRAVGNIAAAITSNGGTLPMTAVVFPATAGQAVSWSIIPVTGTASINASGLVTAQSNGTVYAKAVSVSNSAKMDSLQITISNQTGTSIQDQMLLMGIKLYPNPAGHDLYLSIEKAHPAVEVIITDLSGRAISRSSYESNSLHHPKAVSVRDLSPGIYYLQLKGAAIDMVMKFVKQ